MAKVFGRARIRVNGKLYDSMKGASLDLGGVKRESKTTANGVAGYTESIQPSRLEFKVPVKSDLSLKELQDAVDVTVAFETDTGKNFTVPKAWSTETGKLSDSDGEAAWVLEGEPAEEH